MKVEGEQVHVFFPFIIIFVFPHFIKRNNLDKHEMEQ